MSTAQLQLAQTLTAQGWVLVENVLTESEVSDAAARIVGLLPQGGSPNDAYGKMEHEEGRQHELNGRLPLDASVCDPAVANLACLPAVVDVAAATLGIPQPKLRLNQTSVAVATYVSEPGGERVDENYEGFHVDWPQEVKRLVDRDDPTTMAEALASGSAALSGVLCCSTVEPRGGAFMVRSGSHAVIERHLRSGDRTMLERLLAQDMTVVESELEPPLEMCAPAGSVIFYHPFLIHDRSENFLQQPRLVVFTHYRHVDLPALIDASYFHPAHVASMDARQRSICGLPEQGDQARL